MLSLAIRSSSRLWAYPSAGENSGGSDVHPSVFIASIVVPLAKLLALTWLLTGVQSGASSRLLVRARVARTLEGVGRWSMVDIYLGGLLVALVHFQPLAAILPGPGAIAFGAVVVLTMFASRSFDARLIWDAPRYAAAPIPRVAHA